MKPRLALISLLVREYDEAIAFFVDKLGFTLEADTEITSQAKRWVVVAPPGPRGTALLLARASHEVQMAAIGRQAGDRVFLFLHTDNFARDYAHYQANGVVFLESPRTEPYGTVAVFEDLYGNKWDLLEPALDS